jgi:hypothetical protein
MMKGIRRPHFHDPRASFNGAPFRRNDPRHVLANRPCTPSFVSNVVEKRRWGSESTEPMTVTDFPGSEADARA